MAAANSLKLPTSVPVLQQRLSESQAANTDLRAQLRRAGARVTEITKEASKRAMTFARVQLPNIAMFGGLGMGIGGVAAWFAYGYLSEWFGADSYAPGLILAGAGAALWVFAPQLVRVSVKNVDRTAPTQTGVRGFGLGVAAYGLYEAYLVYSQPAAP